MDIPLTPDQVTALHWKTAQHNADFGLSDSDDVFLAARVNGLLAGFDNEMKTTFLARADVSAVIEKLKTADPAKIPQIQAAVDAAQTPSKP